MLTHHFVCTQVALLLGPLVFNRVIIWEMLLIRVVHETTLRQDRVIVCVLFNLFYFWLRRDRGVRNRLSLLSRDRDWTIMMMNLLSSHWTLSAWLLLGNFEGTVEITATVQISTLRNYKFLFLSTFIWFIQTWTVLFARFRWLIFNCGLGTLRLFLLEQSLLLNVSLLLLQNCLLDWRFCLAYI